MAKSIFTILRKEGFVLNPDDRVVNGVLKGLERNSGKCPCYHAKEGDEPIKDEDLKCPCKEYRECNHCRCNLYVKEEPTVDTTDLVSKLEQVSKELEKAKAELEAVPSIIEHPFVY